MDSRHAAALTLVTWYLFFPRLHHQNKAGAPGDSSTVESAVPISQWRKSGPFSSAAECQNRLTRFRADSSAALDREMKIWHSHHDDPHEADDVSFMTGAKAQAMAAQCVESDDPRLKGK
ncbi:MAG TPA: hypothetical protein VMU16_03910 [Candidatus Binataceae bacterium]|nr:hypothetical protein [Candidatus Binataceae bacterium]